MVSSVHLCIYNTVILLCFIVDWDESIEAMTVLIHLLPDSCSKPDWRIIIKYYNTCITFHGNRNDNNNGFTGTSFSPSLFLVLTQKHVVTVTVTLPYILGLHFFQTRVLTISENYLAKDNSCVLKEQLFA